MSSPSKAAMPTRALCPWFGAGRLIASLVGREISKTLCGVVLSVEGGE